MKKTLQTIAKIYFNCKAKAEQLTIELQQKNSAILRQHWNENQQKIFKPLEHPETEQSLVDFVKSNSEKIEQCLKFFYEKFELNFANLKSNERLNDILSNKKFLSFYLDEYLDFSNEKLIFLRLLQTEFMKCENILQFDINYQQNILSKCFDLHLTVNVSIDEIFIFLYKTNELIGHKALFSFLHYCLNDFIDEVFFLLQKNSFSLIDNVIDFIIDIKNSSNYLTLDNQKSLLNLALTCPKNINFFSSELSKYGCKRVNKCIESIQQSINLTPLCDRPNINITNTNAV